MQETRPDNTVKLAIVGGGLFIALRLILAYEDLLGPMMASVLYLLLIAAVITVVIGYRRSQR